MHSPQIDAVSVSRNLTLADLSQIKASELTFSVIYLSFVMVVGLLGNSLVLKIFYCRFQPSTHRCFILVLAFYDCIACSVGAPFTIAELFFAFTYTDQISCRIFRFILYYTCIASSLTLVLIALERFRKICRPLKSQMTVKGAKLSLFIVVGIISSVSAAPALIIYGNATVSTGYRNMTGTKCFITDYFKQTPWPTVFNVYLLVLAVASTICMTVCYVRIARQVAKMGQDNVNKRGSNYDRTDPDSRGFETAEDSMIERRASKKLPRPVEPVVKSSREDDSNDPPERTLDALNNTVYDTPNLTSTAITESLINSRVVSKMDSSGSQSKWENAKRIIRTMSSKSTRKTLRITKMLTFVTVAFVLSYTPHLTLMLVSMLSERIELPKNNLNEVIFYSFLINNIFNPLIYAAMDRKFRREIRGLCQRSKRNDI